ncbi:MAG: 50S ribosomal protein L30 [bacterium]
MGKIQVTLVKSTIGKPENQKRIVQSLGLRKLHHTVEHDDNPRIRGMVNKVSHLLKTEFPEEK